MAKYIELRYVEDDIAVKALLLEEEMQHSHEVALAAAEAPVQVRRLARVRCERALDQFERPVEGDGTIQQAVDLGAVGGIEVEAVEEDLDPVALVLLHDAVGPRDGREHLEEGEAGVGE